MNGRGAMRTVDPMHDVRRFEERRLDLVTVGQLRRRQEADRRFGDPQFRKRHRLTGDIGDDSWVESLVPILVARGILVDDTILNTINEATADIHSILTNSTASDSVVTFGTTLTTIASTSVGPLVAGVTYLLICRVDVRLSVDTTGFARAFARTQASSSSIAGTRTGTVDGERSCTAKAVEVVVGAGASVTMSARGQMDTSTGYASAAFVDGDAIPIGGG